MTQTPIASPRQRPAPPTDLKPYFLTLPDVEEELGGVLDWPEFFGNEHPVELDIGCGRGLFLVTAGEANPQTNYLGMEIDYREGRRTARRLKRRSLSNVRVLGGDANQALRNMIRPQSVAAVHVYFPDPWWKRKHRRRRIFTDKFVDLCTRVLAPGGLLHSWTDVEEYFAVIKSLMDHDSRFEPLPPPAERSPTHDMDYQTSFERKKRREGFPIYRGRWRLRSLILEPRT